MELPLYLFRGTIGGSIREDYRSKTYNFKKYAKELDHVDTNQALSIQEAGEMYEFINMLKGK